jgi:hypothetical protein
MAFNFQDWIKETMSTSRFTMHPAYDFLPGCVKHFVSAEQYAWMTEAQRNNLIETECYPEPEDD